MAGESLNIRVYLRDLMQYRGQHSDMHRDKKKSPTRPNNNYRKKLRKSQFIYVVWCEKSRKAVFM